MAVTLEEGSGIPVQKQDLSKIDFGKLTLPEWRGGRIAAKLVAEGIHIGRGPVCVPSVAVNVTLDGYVPGNWIVATGHTAATFTELDQLRAICSQVDQFIATELAVIKLREEFPMSADEAREFLKTNPGEHHLSWQRVRDHGRGMLNNGKHWHTWNAALSRVEVHVHGNWSFDTGFGDHRYCLIESRNVQQAPDWVEVKWTEVERLISAGARVQWSCGKIEPVWHERDSAEGFSNLNYQVDRKTLPDGVALYEPEWVPVGWSNVAKAVEAGVEVYYRPDSSKEFKALSSMPYNRDRGFITNQYQADRKTFPHGFELAKVEPVKERTLREKVDCVLTARHSSGVATPYEVISALVDVLDAERSKGAVI